MLDRVVRCGAKYQHKLRVKQGFSSTELRGFEESIKAGLGVKGLGSFQGTIKNQTQKNITFSEETEEEHQLEFQAPACGFYQISLFQRIRHFNFEFSRPKFFGGETKWCSSISKRVPNYHDDSTVEQNDPSCSCPPPDEDFEAKLRRDTVLVLHDKFSLKAACYEKDHILRGRETATPVVHIPALNISLKGPLSRLYWPRFTLWTNHLPDHLVALAHIVSKTVDIEFAAALRESLIDLESMFALTQEQLRNLYPTYFESIERPRPAKPEIVSAEQEFFEAR